MKDRQQENNIDELVFAYQNGNAEAGEEVLRAYGGHPSEGRLTSFLGKYYKMIRYGKLDFKDKDSREFVGLLIQDTDTRKQLAQSYQYKTTKQMAVRQLGYLVQSMRVVDDEDLMQDLRMLFLQQMKRYKKKHRNFGAYIYGSYRYAVYNHIENLLKPKDIYTHQSKLVRLAEDCLHDNDADIDVKDSVLARAPMIMMEEELGNSWVRGLTCGEEFKDLTPLQRLIIKLNYYDGYTDGKIADMMGIHINTIFRQRKKAGLIVEETVKKLVEEGYYS